MAPISLIVKRGNPGQRQCRSVTLLVQLWGEICGGTAPMSVCAHLRKRRLVVHLRPASNPAPRLRSWADGHGSQGRSGGLAADGAPLPFDVRRRFRSTWACNAGFGTPGKMINGGGSSCPNFAKGPRSFDPTIREELEGHLYCRCQRD